MKRDDFELLFREQANGLYGFLVYQCGNPSIAEDVLADAFERALKARARFDPAKGEAKAWLFSIAMNRLRDVQRRSITEARAVSVLQAEPRADNGFEEHVIRSELLAAALAKLRAEERVVLALRFGGDFTAPEIAAVLDQPVKRIEGRIYRGLKKLRRELDAAAPAAGARNLTGQR